MSKILVVCYSRTGFTRAVAELVATACDADLELIEDAIGYGGALGYARSALDAATHLETPIKATKLDPGAYDIIVIGTPIWLWNVASPIRTYIKANRHKFRRVAIFCTCVGYGRAKVMRDLENLVRRPVFALLSCTNEEIADKCYNGRLTTFLSEIKTSSRFLVHTLREEAANDTLVRSQNVKA